ncbi:QacE family quaternary ammonium compound efflux SMR transporter [Nitrospira sp.]|nr:QacE family quaternary ammonium compound efflux SMR transporter [Nitrospira sp.]
MAWVYLFVAGLFEIGWALGLKYSDGFTRPWHSLWTLVAMTLSLWCLALAIRTIPLGTGYAVWTGIGAAGTAILGMILFQEPSNPVRLASIAAIVIGIVGLKLAS